MPAQNTKKAIPTAESEVQNTPEAEAAGGGSKSRVPQSDVPSMTVTQAARLAKTIADNFAYKSTKPLNLAHALNMQPSASTFRMLCGASSAYGFTKGAWNSSEISLEQSGLSYVRPLVEGEDVRAFREALLKPRVVGEFLRKYQNAPLPREDIARNVLVDLNVPVDRAEEVLKLILQGAQDAGFIKTINARKYVDLDAVGGGIPDDNDHQVLTVKSQDEPERVADEEYSFKPPVNFPTQMDGPSKPNDDLAMKRVFITHGKNRTQIDLIKRFLSYADMEPVVMMEKETVATPIPEKMMEVMRSCRAAVIHVDAEKRLVDAAGNESIVINENVLIEIGAAMALYGQRFILLVKSGITLPSNLQGLSEVRYNGDELDGTSVMKLLEALSDLKKRPTPT